MINYFCNSCDVFFEAEQKVEFCPVCQNKLLAVDTWKFILEWEKRCPITLKKLDQNDPEYLVFNPEKLLFHKKKIKKEIPVTELRGSLVEFDKIVLDYLTLKQYSEIRKKYGKKSYTINKDGSFQEKGE